MLWKEEISFMTSYVDDLEVKMQQKNPSAEVYPSNLLFLENCLKNFEVFYEVGLVFSGEVDFFERHFTLYTN